MPCAHNLFYFKVAYCVRISVLTLEDIAVSFITSSNVEILVQNSHTLDNGQRSLDSSGVGQN